MAEVTASHRIASHRIKHHDQNTTLYIMGLERIGGVLA